MALNPIMQALQNNPQQAQQSTITAPNVTVNPMQQAVMQAQQMMQDYQKMTNPAAYIQQRLQNDPAFQRAVQRINQFKDPRQAFMTRCQELGVDPNEFLKQYKGGM